MRAGISRIGEELVGAQIGYLKGWCGSGGLLRRAQGRCSCSYLKNLHTQELTDSPGACGETIRISTFPGAPGRAERWGRKSLTAYVSLPLAHLALDVSSIAGKCR